MKQAKTAIIVLNWNGWQDTIECLESIFKINYENYHVMVVDNGSTDDSVSKIMAWARAKKEDPQSRKEDQVTIIKTGENLGFARGNNFGIRYALAGSDCQYLMVLNNDTVVTADFLVNLLRVLNENAQIGLVGPKVLDYYTGAYWQEPIRHKLNLLTYLIHATPLRHLLLKKLNKRRLSKDASASKVYVIGGSCMLFKREALEKVGLFDEKTFLGWEEYIIAEKLRRENLDVYFVPDSIIYHKVGKDTNRIMSVQKALIFSESERYYQDKYSGMSEGQKLVIRMLRLLFYVMFSLRDRSYRGKMKQLVKAIFGGK